MQQWDYKTIVLTGGFMGRHKEELNRPAFEKHLDELGNEGYELCWVLLEQALQKEKDGHVLQAAETAVTDDEPYAVCESCRQQIDPSAPDTVRALEIVDLGPTSGHAHNYAEGMPTVFHSDCFPEDSPRCKRR